MDEREKIEALEKRVGDLEKRISGLASEVASLRKASGKAVKALQPPPRVTRR